MKIESYKELKRTNGRSYAIGYYVGLILTLMLCLAGVGACALLLGFGIYVLKMFVAYLIAEQLFNKALGLLAIIILLYCLIKNNNCNY